MTKLVNYIIIWRREKNNKKMNITRKTAYSLRALYEVVVNGNGDPVTRDHIARNQNLSRHFLENLFKKLTAAGITRSIRGPGGGFVLNKPADTITVWDVYRAVENRPRFYDKCAFLTKQGCDLILNCRVKHIWPRINQAIEESMSTITLRDICNPGLGKGGKNEKTGGTQTR